MNRRAMITLTTTAMASLGLLAVQDNAAFARTQAASMGTAQFAAENVNFNAFSFGVTRAVATPTTKVWVMPLALETYNAVRTPLVMGKVTSGSSLCCQVVMMTERGVPLGASSRDCFDSFPDQAMALGLVLSISQVPTNSFGQVFCEFVGTGGTMYGVKYTP
jgi:hypothetical protein